MQIGTSNTIPGTTKALKLLFFFAVFAVISLNLILIFFMAPFSIWMGTNGTAKNIHTLNISDIKERMLLMNKEQKILNKKKFGPLLNDSLVIVVQVHSRIFYLKQLIISLRVARSISTVLIIFSHDCFDEEINNLIQSIRFCKVMQIFYPYSIQIYPNEFPGSGHTGCSSNMSTTTSSTTTSRGEENEMYRDPSKLQVKHHWWWKANRIFKLKALKTYEKSVLFLEEDLYIVEDFIPVLKLMERVSTQSCQNCKIMSLAVYTQAVDISSSNLRFLHTVTISNQFKDLLGLAFNRATWMEIVQCRSYFCVYNEHNWDFSLKNVLIKCMENVMAMTVNAPRVFHMGTCGMHYLAQDCDPTSKLIEIYTKIFKYRQFLYPKQFHLIYRLDSESTVGGPYGEWNDSRDQALCLLMTEKDTIVNLTATDMLLSLTSFFIDPQQERWKWGGLREKLKGGKSNDVVYRVFVEGREPSNLRE